MHRIGRTARLGEQGDAISFACDEYAMSLPDIESFIEQKIPVERFEAEMLLPVPTKRAPKANGDANESIVEDAIADATAERKRRRDRDRGDRAAKTGKASGNNRNRRSSKGQNNRHDKHVAETSRASSDRKSRSRRRPRKDNPKSPEKQQADNQSSSTKIHNPPPKLRTRILRAIKSIANRFGGGGR